MLAIELPGLFGGCKRFLNGQSYNVQCRVTAGVLCRMFLTQHPFTNEPITSRVVPYLQKRRSLRHHLRDGFWHQQQRNLLPVVLLHVRKLRKRLSRCIQSELCSRAHPYTTIARPEPQNFRIENRRHHNVSLSVNIIHTRRPVLRLEQ